MSDPAEAVKRQEPSLRQNEEALMSLFDMIRSLFGKNEGDATSVPEALVAALGEREGGLGGLIQQFEGAGLGDVVSSWVGNGQNQAISPDMLHNVLGSDVVQQIAAKTGLPVEQLLPQIAQYLPQLVDHATPDGQVPSSDSGLLDLGLSFLRNRAG